MSSQASAFFKKSAPKKGNLNLLPQVNSFSSVFNLSTLSEKEAQEIEALLLEGAENISAFEVKRDIARVQNITAEVRSINKQGLILIGERLTKAREILRRYGDGKSTFTDWLIKTFGSKRTAYNILSYYELHEALPDDTLKEKFKALPLKAAYVLASRKGEVEQKAEIVEAYAGEKPRVMIEKIQKAFPLKRGDKRKGSKESQIRLLEKICAELKRAKLSQEERERVVCALNQFTK
ncbi:MAG: CT583 family protein [Candidatus Algichlamydia australiensis]|nr:CT583 family protein [Chlamydiales bacterium]